MKKLALLVGALSLVSSVAYAKEVVPAVEEVVVVEEVKAVEAAPALTVTYVGQGLEIDNTSGAEDRRRSAFL
jgi:opacity protein-like surface antigen